DENSPTVEMLMRAFAALEDQYVCGVCTGDWGDPSSPRAVKQRARDLLSEETDDWDQDFYQDEMDTPDAILDHLDMIHDESLNILADLSDDEFQHRTVDLPWGETGTIARLLLGLVEREIHHRTELFLLLKHFGIRITDQVIFGP
ncbi:MAG TPA: hypothetical protein VGB30_01030, partial [bacterium]